jgi:hypothetical protein
MKKIAMAFLFCLAGSIVNAQDSEQSKPVKCFPLQSTLKSLGEHWKEKPVWTGQGRNSNFALFVNGERGTWTFIEFDNEVACVLGMGQDSQIKYPGPKI